MKQDTYELLDLYCKAGGASHGYALAGFNVTGVDIEPQPNYPYKFFKADAIKFAALFGRDFHAIAASPPCQGYSAATPMAHRKKHPDLIGPTRHVLRQVGRPSIIENVGGARWEMESALMLCGTMFPGLRVQRHRFFEFVCWHPLILTPKCKHDFRPIVVNGTTYREHDNWERRHEHSKKECADAMGIDVAWMTRKELDNAIPPAYTKFLGGHLITYLNQHK